MRQRHKSAQGFTLIELSIVLVIIGLIIGGVLVGQDMIKNAEIRATVGQVEKYNAAVNTFRGKYNALPGDLDGVTESRFGFLTRTNAAGKGDGNGQIDGCAAAAKTVLGCETALFWRDLSFANMIEGSYTTATDAVSASLTAATIPLYIPGAKLGRGNYFLAYGVSGFNYYQIGGVASTDGSGVVTVSEALTPAEAQNIDLKLDDGLPTTGIVLAREGTTVDNAVTVASDECATDDLTPNPYNTTTTTLAATPMCQVRIRFN